jgi:hypothetical protein
MKQPLMANLIRTALSFILLIILNVSLLAQGNVQFSLAVINNQNQPLGGLTVVAVETTTLKTQTTKTSPQGRATLKLEEGKEWAISIGLIKKAIHVVSIQGHMTAVNKMYVYDLKEYNRKLLQDQNRTTEKFKVISRVVDPKPNIKPGECFLGLALRHPDGRMLPDVNVAIVNVRDSIVYKSKTDVKGFAYFILSNKTNYEIDIDEIRNFGYCDFGDEYKAQRLVLEFAPTVVKEKVVNDTTYQEVTAQSQPSSARAFIALAVHGGKKNGVRERVYMRQIPSGKVYAAITNDEGYAYFLIPNKYIYMVDFKYQRDVDAINLLYSSDMTSGRMTVRYTPDPRLEYPETFIPTTQNLLIKNFNDFLGKQFARPKNKPFNLDLKSVRRIHRQSQEALFMLKLSGAELGNVRLPLNTALVLDKSGSMYSDDRSEALRRSLLAIGVALADTDIVSVVLFDDGAYEVQQSTTNHLEGFRTIADNYSPSGGTNIYAGLKLGEASIMRSFDKDKSNKIILLTDGYDSTPPKEITDYVEAKYKEGIEFSTIGLGTDYNQSLLELIAMKGNGSFNFVDSAMALSDAFLKEVKGSFGYSASDLKIEIFHNEKLIFSNLYGYPVSGQTKQSVSFEIGKVPYGTNRLAFLKFKLNNASPELQAAPLKMKVTYYDLAKKQAITYQEEVKLEWTTETSTELMFDQEERKLYAIAILNQSMKMMAEAYEGNDPKGAKAALQEGIRQLEEIFPDARPKDVQLLFEEVKRYVGLFVQMEKNEK